MKEGTRAPGEKYSRETKEELLRGSLLPPDRPRRRETTVPEATDAEAR